MLGHCALCRQEAQLRHSHLVPEFFERRLKEDAGTPYFRGAEPNRRIQSGPKMPLLCDACEGRFSVTEAEFAKNFYHPTRDGEQFEIVWTRGLAQFVASITWRNLISKIRHNDRLTSDLDPEDWAAIETAEDCLRSYLLGRISYPSDIEHHVFTASGAIVTEHPSVNTFFNMGIAMSTPATNETVYSVVVVPGMLFVALLNASDDCRRLWRNGTLAVPDGTIQNHRQRIKDGALGYLLIEQAKKFDARHALLSPKQKAVIAREARRNVAIKRPNSIIGWAWRQDVRNRHRAEAGDGTH